MHIEVLLFMIAFFRPSTVELASIQPIQPAQPSSISVKEEMQSWLDSIANMRIEWSTHNPDTVKAYYPKFTDKDPTEEELLRYYYKQSFLWEKSGSFKREILKYEDGVLVFRQIIGASSEHQLSYTLHFTCVDGTSTQERLSIRAFQQSDDNNVVLPLRGWMSKHGKSWFPEQVQLPSSLELDANGRVMLEQENMNYVLEPRYNYLPTKIELKLDNSPTPAAIFEVKVFAATPSGKPYPLRGTEASLEQGKYVTDVWETLHFDVNEVLPPTAFEPPQPEKGVMIEDSLSGRNYRAEFTQWDRIVEVAKKARLNSPDASYDRTNFQGKSVIWWIPRISLMLILTVTIIQVFRGIGGIVTRNRR